jgi:superfamily II RNA helicase
LKNQKRDKARAKQANRDKMNEKKEMLMERSNQRERIRKITGISKKSMTGEYLLNKQMQRMFGGGNIRIPELDDIAKLVGKLKSDNLLPAIVFVFSKKKLNAMTQKLTDTLSLLTRDEQRQVSVFFHKCTRRLKPNDQAILQLKI